jgi:hypothetical protein
MADGVRQVSDLPDLVLAAESAWLDRWTEGPTERASALLSPGTPAPNLALPDETGTLRRLSEFWAGGHREGRPPVDDPWRAAAEFVVGATGLIRLAYAYQHCEDYPEPRVLTTAGRLS